MLFENCYNVLCSLNVPHSHLKTTTELGLMDHVNGWVNLAKECLKLLFKSIYVIYDRHIDLFEF